MSPQEASHIFTSVASIVDNVWSGQSCGACVSIIECCVTCRWRDGLCAVYFLLGVRSLRGVRCVQLVLCSASSVHVVCVV